VDLVRELTETSSWVHLGLYLGLPKHKLNEIYTDYGTQGLARSKLEMLSCILDWRGDTLSWATVMEAVSKTGNNRIAKKIADKHGTLPQYLSSYVSRDGSQSPHYPISPLHRAVITVK